MYADANSVTSLSAVSENVKEDVVTHASELLSYAAWQKSLFAGGG